MPRLDSKLGKVEGALMELPIPIESIDAGLPVLGGAVGKSPGPEANGLFARRFFGRAKKRNWSCSRTRRRNNLCWKKGYWYDINHS